MFGWKKNIWETLVAAPPEGVLELIFCVYDEKLKLKHHYRSVRDEAIEDDRFRFLNEPTQAIETGLLAEAASTGKPATISFAYGAGLNKLLYVMPYERKRDKLNLACIQISMDRSSPDQAPAAYVCALNEGKAFFLIADPANHILAVSAKVPEAFGYSSNTLQEVSLAELFGPSDLSMIASSAPDSNQSILSCVFHCLDGSRRDVEVKKYTATDGCMLFGISDVTRLQLNEEITAVASRERRRIGQDLHDSIGQVLTGISLLSRSLANSLERAGSVDCQDAKQVSELADDANNQIRQISRGLMPSEVVQRGLYPSLRELAQLTTDSCGFTCDAVIDEQVEIHDGAIETHLFRIAQEAVNNAVRHSGGNRITIYISDEDGNPKLKIQDNGRWRHIIENQGGIGLKTMEYRASAINGQLDIRQLESGGTCVICQLEAEEFLETKVL